MGVCESVRVGEGGVNVIQDTSVPQMLSWAKEESKPRGPARGAAMGLGQSSKTPAADDTGEGELRSSFLFMHHKVKQGWRVK